MAPCRNWVVALVFASIPGLCFGQQVYTLTPPDEIGRHLDSLRRNENRAAATRALAGRADAAPYLRVELLAAREPLFRKDLAETLATIESKIRERTKGRFAEWTRARRFDLCTEGLSTWPDKNEAVALIGHLTPVLHQLGAEFEKTHGLGDGQRERFHLPVKFDLRGDRAYHYAGEALNIPFGSSKDGSVVRAETCDIGLGEMTGLFVAVRSELRYTAPRDVIGTEWVSSVVLVNNSMPLEGVASSLIVCDGDVEWHPHWSHSTSLIVANGNIQAAKLNRGWWRKCTLCATGNIILPDDGPLADCRFHAGGTVARGGMVVPDQVDRVKQRQKALPFGVRFLDPKEFGLDLAADKGGLRVAGLAAWSPFAGHDLREGDVIVKINGVAADTVPAFRRELRRSVILESAVLHVRRGGETLGRVVFLDGIPTDPARVAPPPREVKR